MNVPIQLQRIPKRKRPMKPATQRALFFVAVVCLVVFFAGVIAKCTPNPVFPL